MTSHPANPKNPAKVHQHTLAAPAPQSLSIEHRGQHGTVVAISAVQFLMNEAANAAALALFEYGLADPDKPGEKTCSGVFLPVDAYLSRHLATLLTAAADQMEAAALRQQGRPQ